MSTVSHFVTYFISRDGKILKGSEMPEVFKKTNRQFFRIGQLLGKGNGRYVVILGAIYNTFDNKVIKLTKESADYTHWLKFPELYENASLKRPVSDLPAGLVYRGVYASLYFTGGADGCYYIVSSGRDIQNYLFTSKTNRSLTIEKGLAMVKALDMYEKDDVKLLFYPEKQAGFVTDYFSDLLNKLRNHSDNENELMVYIIDYNEALIADRLMIAPEGFDFL